MASEPAWRTTRAGWRERVGGWMAEPGEDELLDAATGLDMRTVAGAFAARGGVADLLARAPDRGIFLGRLARAAFRHAPPLGFRGRLAVSRSGDDAGTFDVKAGALLPITDLDGSPRWPPATRRWTRSTGWRWRQPMASSRLTSRPRCGRGSSWRWGSGSTCTSAQHRAGLSESNRVDPSELSPLLRSQLREVFKAVRVAQDAGRSRYHTDLLG